MIKFCFLKIIWNNAYLQKQGTSLNTLEPPLKRAGTIWNELLEQGTT